MSRLDVRPRAPDPAAIALALALGHGAELDAAHWESVFAVSRQERLHLLAWRRSGDMIRRYAPPAIIAAWRAEAVAGDHVARLQQRALGEIAAAARAAGLPVTSLKGVALGVHLYGDVGTRPCCDLDLLIEPEWRRSGHVMLEALGWTAWNGEAPFHTSYRCDSIDGRLYLEVHSFLVPDLLSHCTLPVRRREDTGLLAGVPVHVLEPAVACAHLAVNITKHAVPSLLSFVDLYTMWQGLSPDQRTQTTQLMRAGRLSRCFAWALQRAALVPSAAAGEATALQLLGYRARARAHRYPTARLAQSADSLWDAARIVAWWAWPHHLRDSPAASVQFWWERVRRPVRRWATHRRAYASSGRT